MLFNNKTNGKQEKSSILSDNDIWKKRADILYPDMETKEEDSVFEDNEQEETGEIEETGETEEIKPNYENIKGLGENTIKQENREDILYPDMPDKRSNYIENEKQEDEELNLDSKEKNNSEIKSPVEEKEIKEEITEAPQGIAEKENSSEISNYIKDEVKRADILYPTMKDKEKVTMTGGAAKIYNPNQPIAGVEKGEPMSFEDAGKGVNPKFDYYGNTTYNTNCQSCVAIFEARIRGYNITATNMDSKKSEIKNKLSYSPNLAYIDPKTGKIPEFTTIKVSNSSDLEKFLDEQIKQNERYIFSFNWKRKNVYSTETGYGHIVSVTKDKNDNLKFYDPQSNRIYNKESFYSRIKFEYKRFEEKTYPEILRVDDKDLNYDILNNISKAEEK